jgi:putative ABC transport system permease protein
MLTRLWIKGILAQRPGRLLGAALGVALTVALLAVLGAFIAVSAAAMTARAIADVPVDWQIQLVPGADRAAITGALGQATTYTALQPVGYADTTGLTASTQDTVQTTGPGKILGLDSGYARDFPGEIRPLIGATTGVLIAQQTAANLHVTVGDTVTIGQPGLPSAAVRIDGIVDLPNADSLFQAVGVPTGSAPQAPPDNVLLLPSNTWHRLFDPQAAQRPDTVRLQLHVRLAHNLPPDPNTAFTTVQGRAHNLEARIAGSGIVGDNLAARLDGVRADALYAQVLFLFLGLPGALLAMVLTLAVAASGADRRRQEQALLRTRGASTSQILRLVGLEALLVGGVGALGGLLLAQLAAGAAAADTTLIGASAWAWTLAAVVIGLLLALVAVLVPAWDQARHSTVVAARVVAGAHPAPLWQRVYLDVIVLGTAALAFWQSASSGYQVVLAPEGVAQTAVSYQTFLAPVGLWIGGGLLTLRLCAGGLARGRDALAAALRPLAHGLARIVATALGRQRLRVAQGVVLVALAFSFAISTAVFNMTYNAQARVDAELTNGADVTVTGTTTAPPGDRFAALRAVPGVVGIAPMQHRFAYVGNDLQDLYGIDPAHIGEATNMANAFFANGSARDTLAALAAHRDGVLVSQETVNDFQLNPGDQLNLRLQNSADHQYHVIPFHFIGVVREFPTAPKDSFLVANASYVAEQTGTPAAEIVLLRAAGDPAALAARVQDVVGSLAGAKVSELGATQRTISSSLTAIDLGGLTELELGFALLLVAGATGLVLALGLAERHRTYAILAALGARSDQLGAFLWSEAALLLLGGGIAGGVLGFALAQLLVTVLMGVFDPPPDALAVPWAYLALLAVAAVGATAGAVLGAQRAARQAVVAALRDI